MPYYVIDAAGNPYGPAELGLLQQWVQEGRITATTTIRDVNGGQQMVASAVPGLFPVGSSYSPPSHGSPYGPSPYQQLGPGPAYYPRPYGLDDGSKDGVAAWVLGVLSVILGLPVCCPLLGLLGIIGVVYSRRALSKGYNAQVPLILSYVGIGIGSVFTVLWIISMLAANTTTM